MMLGRVLIEKKIAKDQEYRWRKPTEGKNEERLNSIKFKSRFFSTAQNQQEPCGRNHTGGEIKQGGQGKRNFY
jgi:hypothetical protein